MKHIKFLSLLMIVYWSVPADYLWAFGEDGGNNSTFSRMANGDAYPEG